MDSGMYCQDCNVPSWVRHWSDGDKPLKQQCGDRDHSIVDYDPLREFGHSNRDTQEIVEVHCDACNRFSLLAVDWEQGKVVWIADEEVPVRHVRVEKN